MSHHDADAPLPHVAYVLLWYPLFTQPFIFREVEGLRERGLPLTVYSLYALSLHQCSEEMQAAAPRTRAFGSRYLGVFLGELFRQLFSDPRRLLSLLRRTLFRRWRSLETFGENVWGFLAGVYLARLFREDGIDMIHAPWPRGTTTAAWVASSLSGIPFSTAARGDNLDPTDPDLVDKLCAAQFVRANNRADVRRMEAMLPPSCVGKIHLVYNSLTLAVRGVCPVHMTPPVKLLALGRFDITKGFEYLLEACALLKKEGLSFHLTLAGGGGKRFGLGDLGPRLEKMREDLELTERVSMPGLLSHNILPDVLMAHDIFVAPCVVHASGRRDGIPNTIIEAMAHGLPVVSTCVNAIPEIVRDGETGYTVPEKDAPALALAILRMVEHPEEARRMADSGRVLVDAMFNPEKNIRALRELFVSQHALRKA